MPNHVEENNHEGHRKAIRTRASYGKACLACVTSKTKCESSNNPAKCKRCFYLDKECQPAPSKRKTGLPNGRSRPSPAKVESEILHLEENLDGINQLLRASQHGIDGFVDKNGSGNKGKSTRMSRQASESLSSRSHPLDLSSPQRPSPLNGSNDSTGASSALPYQVPSPKERINESDDHADYPAETEEDCIEYLETYRSKMVPIYPVVPISEHETVTSMSENRPFLWLVIRATSNKNVSRQIALGKEIKVILARELVIEGMKTMDLLQGILVFGGWCHHWIFRKPFLSMALYMGMSLITELGLNKPIVPKQEHGLLNIGSGGCPLPPHLIRRGYSPRTLDERRALVGLFLVTSMFSLFTLRTEIPRWTPYHEECLQVLEQSKEYPSDEILVHLIRIQLIKNKASNINWLEPSAPGSISSQLRQEFYVNEMSGQLQKIKNSLPEYLKSNPIIEVQILGAILSLHEYNLNASPSGSPFNQDLRSNTEPQDEATARFEGLSVLLSTLKEFFIKMFDDLSFPVKSYPIISMGVFTQMSHAIIILFRISTFELPGFKWDRKKVIEEIDFGVIVRGMAERWKSVPLHCGIIRKMLDTGEELDEEETKEVQIYQDVDEDAWTHAGKAFSLLGHTWDNVMRTFSEEGDQRVAGIGNMDPNDSLNHNQQYHQAQPNMNVPNGIFNGETPDDWWVTGLLGENGQEWFIEF